MRRKKKAVPTTPAKTAVIYARFSSSKQREASIDDQLRVCTRWCLENGYSIVGTYCDRAASGRTDDRPRFQEMIANAGESEIVLVYMMDRFSRDVYDAPIYKRKLRDKGVRVVSATESMPDGPEAMLMESIYEAMAAMESEHTSIRTRRGMDGNALKLMHNGVRIYGYDLGDDGMYHINEMEAQNVREMFALRAEGKSYGWIAERMAARGVRTTSKKRRPCSYEMVRLIIRNEKYKGVYSWGDVRVEDGMPAIVTKEEWDMAQGIRSAKSRQTEDWTDYAFSGKGVCGCCGSNLVGVSGRNRRNVKYTYYRCSNGCGAKTVRADVLEERVARAVRRFVSQPDVLEDIVSAVSRAMESDGEALREKALREELADLERREGNLMAAVEQGMPYAQASARIEEIVAQKDRITQKLLVMSNKVEFDPKTFVEYLCSNDGADDRTMLDVFVWQVQLFDDRVIVVLTYDVKAEPARIEIPAGSTELTWLPTINGVRTQLNPRKVTVRVRVCDGVHLMLVDGAVMLDVSMAGSV